MVKTTFKQRVKNLGSDTNVASVTDEQLDAILADADKALADIVEANESVPVDYLSDAKVTQYEADKHNRATYVIVANSGHMADKPTAKVWVPDGMSNGDVANFLAILANRFMNVPKS